VTVGVGVAGMVRPFRPRRLIGVTGRWTAVAVAGESHVAVPASCPHYSPRQTLRENGGLRAMTTDEVHAYEGGLVGVPYPATLFRS
jgi:hypothetical protein